jgi:hypothetical protein
MVLAIANLVPKTNPAATNPEKRMSFIWTC